VAVVTEKLGGIICVNKPQGFTSFDVIAKMRGILKMRRLGHAGTLDPMATGVLPVFVGTATKACDILPDHDKIYRAGFSLGITTDTQDITGTVTARADFTQVGLQQLENAVKGFVGEIMQIPPMYSAVSVGGKRLYKLAREGKTVEREPRKITIYSLSVTEYDEESGKGFMETSCSKGTYIRTLINDIGDSLGCGGIMTSLVRTAACGFTLGDCITLEELQCLADKERGFSSVIIPTEKLFTYLPEIRLSPAQEKMYRNGVKLQADRVRLSDKAAERYAVYGNSGFMGTAVVKDGLVRVEKNF